MKKDLLRLKNPDRKTLKEYILTWQHAEHAANELSVSSAIDVNKTSTYKRGKHAKWAEKNDKNIKKCAHCFQPQSACTGGAKCPALTGTCNECKKKGHWRPNCPKLKKSTTEVRNTEVIEAQPEGGDGEVNVNAVSSQNTSS